MAEQETFQLQGDSAQIYEGQQVPSLFRPLAELTFQHVDVPEGSRVLDAACGTGIVGRMAAEKAGRSGSVVGIDLNAAMIEVAKQNSPVTSAAVGWRQGDVTALPFPDASFDIAFCQQGLQFFPSKLAALTELRRGLAPGGSLILTVWSEIPPLAAARSQALAKYINAEVAKSALAPFSFHDQAAIQALMVEAGFQAIQMETLIVQSQIGLGPESIRKGLAAQPYANEVAKLDGAVQDALIDDIDETVEKYRVGDVLFIPQKTHLVRATA